MWYLRILFEDSAKGGRHIKIKQVLPLLQNRDLENIMTFIFSGFRAVNRCFFRHISPFTQLLNVESRFLIERMRTFTIKDLIQSCRACVFSHGTVHFSKYKREQLGLCYDE